MSDQVQPEPSTDPFEELDAALKRDIDQLIDQGCLSEAFTFGGHSYVIKTLLPNEANAASLAMQGLQGTNREVQAYMQATVGLALVALDNDTDFHMRVGDLNTHGLRRFEWIGANLDDVIIAYVFKRYNVLDQRRIRARAAITNLPVTGQSPSTHWPDSSTGPGIFSAGTPMESPFSPM